MESYDRPSIHALVAYFDPKAGFLSPPRLVPLEEAADLSKFGLAVLVDPADERELAMWERLQRAVAPKRKWFDAPE